MSAGAPPIFEAALREAFKGKASFIGQDAAFVTSHVGPATSHVEFAVGVTVYSWVRPGFRADAWFKKGICSEVKVRDLDGGG